MTLKDTIDKYNSKIGNIVNVRGANTVDLCSIKDVIDNTREFAFKVSLFPSDLFANLLDFTDTTLISDLSNMEGAMTDRYKQIAFYPKYNITFEKTMHVPILNLDALSMSDLVEETYQIPIQVNFYMLFNNTINTLKRYYNSNIYFDHTAYMNIPQCIVSHYNFDDLFQWDDASSVFPDPVIQSYGIDFTKMNNFAFTIDDADILAQTKNIVFIEIILSSQMKDFGYYMMMKTGENVYLRKGNPNKFSYRKLYYNLDFINIKNRIVKYSA